MLHHDMLEQDMLEHDDRGAGVSLVDRWLARAVQAASGRMMRPPPSLTDSGADLPLPEQITVGTEAGPVRVQVHRPAAPVGAGAKPAGRRPPVYVNFHGGGFVARHPEFDDHICRALVARTGCVVLNVDYDVAPQRPFPVAPTQAYGVALWAVRNAAEQGWDATRLAVGGQSAGGNLAAGVCRVARDERAFAPVLQVLNYPPLDLVADPATKAARTPKPLISPRIAKLFNSVYVPDVTQRADPLASPGLAGDLEGLAPALVITAELDTLRDEGDRYAASLAAAGVPVTHHVMPGVDHAFTHVEPAGPLHQALDLITGELIKAWQLR